MTDELPPLGSLRCFESAARHSSFALAARELAVTPAAISQQVRKLEDFFETRLFLRGPHTVQLTPAGTAYAESVREALGQIRHATGHLLRSRRRELNLATTPAFASRWLVPRLIHFQRRWPEIEIRLSTSNTLLDLAGQQIDLAIRYGGGNWPGLYARHLISTLLFPVCSPSYLAEHGPLPGPEALTGQRLLHLEHDEWPAWLAMAGISPLPEAGGAYYPDAGLLTQAALEGQGIALGQSVLVNHDLRAGRLVRLFGLALPGQYSYYLAWPRHLRPSAHAIAFMDWLQALPDLTEAGGVTTGAGTPPAAAR